MESQLGALGNDALREENAHWFAEPLGFQKAVVTIWLINLEFTRRGIAPRWRGIPEFMARGAPPPYSQHSTSPRLIGAGLRGTVLKRWIDLEWLRSSLGPFHTTKHKTWNSVFADDWKTAVKGFERVNSISSIGGVPRLQTSYKVIFGLSVPKLHRIALMGMIDRDSGERVKNILKRVDERIRPKMESLMARTRHPLRPVEVERRLVICKAIELAQGSPTDAALVFRWITGEAISRQSIHEQKAKIASQCSLSTTNWISQV